jgi:hypothetical protein
MGTAGRMRCGAFGGKLGFLPAASAEAEKTDRDGTGTLASAAADGLG